MLRGHRLSIVVKASSSCPIFEVSIECNSQPLLWMLKSRVVNWPLESAEVSMFEDNPIITGLVLPEGGQYMVGKQ